MCLTSFGLPVLLLKAEVGGLSLFPIFLDVFQDNVLWMDTSDAITDDFISGFPRKFQADATICETTHHNWGEFSERDMRLNALG